MLKTKMYLFLSSPTIAWRTKAVYGNADCIHGITQKLPLALHMKRDGTGYLPVREVTKIRPSNDALTFTHWSCIFYKHLHDSVVTTELITSIRFFQTRSTVNI